MTLVQSFKTGSYEVTRQEGKGQYVEGYYQPGKTRKFQVSGSLQPVSPRDMQVLEELDRVKQSYKLYTDQMLQTVREVGRKLADRVKVYGEAYVVMQTERWDGTDLPYFKALLVRENLEEEVSEK
jgi:hypothetical protein